MTKNLIQIETVCYPIAIVHLLQILVRVVTVHLLHKLRQRRYQSFAVRYMRQSGTFCVSGERDNR